MRYALFAVGIVVLGGAWLFGLSQEGGEQLPKAIINGVEIQLEVARTPEEQARGLSDREVLGENAGMLFIFQEPTTPSFWMKEMKFPLDIIWIGNDRRIVDISENIAPETFPQLFHPHVPAQYVLEVNAGWAKSHNISVGDQAIFYGIF